MYVNFHFGIHAYLYVVTLVDEAEDVKMDVAFEEGERRSLNAFSFSSRGWPKIGIATLTMRILGHMNKYVHVYIYIYIYTYVYIYTYLYRRRRRRYRYVYIYTAAAVAASHATIHDFDNPDADIDLFDEDF